LKERIFVFMLVLFSVIGPFAWIAGMHNSTLAGNEYQEKICLKEPELLNRSEVLFANAKGIKYKTPSVTARAFRVVSPNGGERIERHRTTIVRWSYSGYKAGIRLTISVSGRSGSLFEIGRDIPIERGSFDWAFTNAPGMYKIEISSMGPGGGFLDRSDGEFEIFSSTRVRLVSPNGGEEFHAGSSMNIRWDVTNPFPTHRVKIILFRYGGGCQDPGGTAGVGTTLSTVLVTDRSYRWNIPDTLKEGNYFTIRLDSEVTGDFHRDDSDGCFRIRSRTRVRVLYPNGGERFRSTDRIDIRWEATNPLPGQKVYVLFCYYNDRCGVGERKCSRIFWIASIGDGHHTFPADALEGRPRSTFIAHVAPEEEGDFPDDTSDNCFTIE